MGKNVGPGVFQVVSGTDFNSVIFGGGIQFVENGGVAIDAMVNNGGSQFVLSGGKAYDTMLTFGGTQTVGDGGFAFSTAINEGAVQNIAHGGETDFAIVNRGWQYLKGVSYFGELMNGGIETIGTFGHAYYTKIDATSLQDVLSQGWADFTDIMSGGKQTIEWNGYAQFTNVHGGGLELLMSHGRADDTTVAFQGVMDSFGWTNRAQVYGSQKIEAGAIDQRTDVYSGGLQQIFAGGTVLDAVIHAGAAQYVSGEADYEELYGYEKVWQSGHVQSTDVYGKQVVDGVAVWSNIKSGGQVVVEAGGVANQTGIGTGGVERILAGGKELDAIFQGAGLLDLDSSNCVGLIDQWQTGARIDLRDIAFGANTVFGYSNGMLSVSDGQHTDYLQFLGQLSTGNFKLSSDGHGGTMITDPVGAGMIVPPMRGF